VADSGSSSQLPSCGTASSMRNSLGWRTPAAAVSCHPGGSHGGAAGFDLVNPVDWPGQPGGPGRQPAGSRGQAGMRPAAGGQLGGSSDPGSGSGAGCAAGRQPPRRRGSVPQRPSRSHLCVMSRDEASTSVRCPASCCSSTSRASGFCAALTGTCVGRGGGRGQGGVEGPQWVKGVEVQSPPPPARLHVQLPSPCTIRRSSVLHPPNTCQSCSSPPLSRALRTCHSCSCSGSLYRCGPVADMAMKRGWCRRRRWSLAGSRVSVADTMILTTLPGRRRRQGGGAAGGWWSGAGGGGGGA